MTKGYLVLETGEKFTGDWLGPEIESEGEVVFNTSMTGYQAMLTDPSYAGQILTFSFPIIGNNGVNETGNESEKVSLSGVILNDLCDESSHYQSTATLGDVLKEKNVSGLVNVDTRSLVKAIRKHKSVKGKIVKVKDNIGEWKEADTLSLVKEVSVQKSETYGNGAYHVVLVDFGYKSSILQALLKENCKVTIVPYHTTFAEIELLHPDGILLSNGPGNPKELEEFLPTVRQLTEKYPTLGISLGHQLIALAYGAKTKRLSVGHRGDNHPVKDIHSGKVSMTSQNHGYVVVEDSIDTEEFEVLYKNVNDQSVEGMKHIQLPVLSVQFHPEAHPGPTDTEYIYIDFIHQVITSGGNKYVEA
ncbi:carbamoyl phosphate synthase small subunit [Oceanobacillus senegalensis]|uniref:carbamoyl phosphate synthase small subunit n=1 Tax=Oceanobacillus senegalensis TaxID=1936063 RepID=UPI000A30B1AF|nr:carbamoyl phosphate synthase small subunit [Oceanobacillus senegalensis]